MNNYSYVMRKKQERICDKKNGIALGKFSGKCCERGMPMYNFSANQVNNLTFKK